MKNRHSRHRIAMAVAVTLFGAAAPAGSAVIVTGPYFTNPGGAILTNGPNLLLPSTEVWLAAGANASFSAGAGSQVELGSLYLGTGGTGLATLDGAGTVLRLNSNGNLARLTIGVTTEGAMTMSGGALLDGRYQPDNCLSGYRFCGTFIGDAAGSTGTLTVTGAGSEARLLGGMTLANGYVNGTGYGTPGGTTSGTVRVEAGGLLRTNDLTAGSGWVPPAANGSEHNIATVVVDGAGSQWLITPNAINGNEAGANFAAGNAKASASLTISNGGRFELQADAGRNAGLRLGNGGSFSGSVTGANSVLWLSADADHGFFHMAENGGTALLDVANGGRIGGARWVNIGLNGGGNATLNLSGGTADFSHGDVWVGNSATGALNVSNGGRLDARQLNVGTGQDRDTGTVTLQGAGSLIALGGAVDTHRLIVGGSGTGAMTVSGGALLDATLNPADCAGHWCGTIIGQMAGDTGRFTVTGTGSEARFLSDFNVGEIAIARPATDGWTGGELNGATHARVEVLAGGRLVTEGVNAGGWTTPNQGGGERSFADLVVSGAGSTWLVTGNALSNRDANLNLARTRNALTTLDISDGGLLRVEAPTGRLAAVDLTAGRYGPGDPTAGGGTSVTTVHGTGSRFEINGATSRLAVGNNAGGTALLQVRDGGAVAQSGSDWSYLNIGEGSASGRVEILSGGQVSGARSVNVGNGGDGSLLISGAGSLLTTDRTGSFVGQLNVGQQGTGRVDVQAGGTASAFSLQVGNGYDHANSWGRVVIDGAGSTVVTDAVDWHRLSINNGEVIVSGGALLDAAGNAATCATHWCGVFIANNAGDNGSFTVTGAGSRASFVSQFNLGQSYVTAPPTTAWTLGEPGATSLAQVNVLAGGRLETGQVYIATGPSGPNATGSEGVIAQVRIKGAGSVWAVSGGSGQQASFMSGMGAAANTLTDIQIADGGQLLLTADASTAAFIQLGSNGGLSRMSITGAGSKLTYGTTNNAGLWIGRNGATASLSVTSGGVIEGVNRLQVGNTGATGTLAVTGSGSHIAYGSAFADLYVGRQGGQGGMAITQGAVVSMDSWLPRLSVASGDGAAGTTGTLRIDGAGSLLTLQSPQSAAGAFDLPQANIGWGGSGSVEISNGGQLLLNGRGTSTPAQIANTRMTVGQNISGINGTGTLNVSGAGSRVSVQGTDPAVYVGRNPGGTGTLNLSSGAALDTTLLDVGLQGGVGALQMNASTLTLTGQHSGSHIGATLGIGLGSGSAGTVRIAGGSTVTLQNNGSEGALLLIGGANSAPGGNGSLIVRASTMQISGPSGVTGAVIGYNGNGQASFENGSLLDVGATGGVVVGWQPGSTGILSLSGGSALTGGYVGVGASRDGDGGVATLIVNDTSSVTANTIEIGAKGYVGGTGTLMGSIVNRGVFSPGNSPGTLHLQGSFSNQAGGKLVLEVEDDGHGGFATDQLVFDAGSSVSLGSLAVEFRFLGGTDPNAFQASGGFQIDSFLRQGSGALDHALLSGTSYSATSSSYQFTSFHFSADGGAVFQAQAVPEPGTWMLFATGLGLGAWLQRRRCGLNRTRC